MAHFKKPKYKNAPKAEKNPKTKDNDAAEKWKTKNPVWKFHKFDKNHSKWGIESVEFKGILEKLSKYEQMTWQDIETAAGGKKKGSNSHFISAKSLSKDARRRL